MRISDWSSDVCSSDLCRKAPTFLDYAELPVPSYMQGRSLRPVLEGRVPDDWPQVAYHRYWMHKDAIHNAFAHYGIRDQRSKLIHWYNDQLDQPGARTGNEQPEREQFDCLADQTGRAACW